MPSLSLRQALPRERIIALGSKLAPAAATLGHLRVLLGNPNAELEEIVGLIRLDPALTFNVVRLSSSVLFCARARSDSLEGAVCWIGFNNLYRLVGLAATRELC